MSTFYPAVMAQAQYACAVLGFIRKLIRAAFPSLAANRTILGTDRQFHAHIDAALMELDHRDATETDYRFAVANAACWEMSNLCELLTDACECARLDDVAKRYLNPTRFLHLVLKQDAARLDALMAAVNSGDRNIGRLLMRVGAILDGRTDGYDAMDASAKRKATMDTKKIIEEVKNVAKKLDGDKAELVEHIDAMGAKVDRLKMRGRRKGKHGETMREVCLSYWTAAQDNPEVRYSINTRITYASVFRHFSRQLEKVGVTSLAKFRAVIRSMQSAECMKRRKQLDAQRDGRKKPPDFITRLPLNSYKK